MKLMTISFLNNFYFNACLVFCMTLVILVGSNVITFACFPVLSIFPPEFDLGSILSNVVGSSFNTAFGRDCKGRPQGDYFFGCQVPTCRCLGESSFLTFSIPYGQCLGPFNIGRRKRSPQDTRFFINSNQVGPRSSCVFMEGKLVT